MNKTVVTSRIPVWEVGPIVVDPLTIGQSGIVGSTTSWLVGYVTLTAHESWNCSCVGYGGESKDGKELHGGCEGDETFNLVSSAFIRYCLWQRLVI